MKHINYLTVAFVFLLMITINNKLFSQNAKPHYIIQNGGSPEETLKYSNALKDFDFEQYRFYNKRRIIKFTNSNATIELFSAKELLDLYQRPVHPFNIMNDIPTNDIEFLYFPTEGKVKISKISKN
jgi:hypothetical protein